MSLMGNLLLQASMYGPMAAFISEMFGTRARYTGASLGYQPATTLGAGPAPLIVTSLLSAAGGGTNTGTVSLSWRASAWSAPWPSPPRGRVTGTTCPPRSRPPHRSGRPLRPDRARMVLRGPSQAAGAHSHQHRQGPRHV
ncbi:hypothetical protein [Streptomyces atratus]|uniref:hypothetical protein n=1 Tax=Streptomyces atratus TaxID=1893 RepID=UPI0037A88492